MAAKGAKEREAWDAAREAEEVAWQAYVAAGRVPGGGGAYDAACKVTDAAKQAWLAVFETTKPGDEPI